MAKSSENTGALRDKREQEKRQATQEDRERMTLCISCIKNVLRVKETGVEEQWSVLHGGNITEG